jgi:hypothetical protein
METSSCSAQSFLTIAQTSDSADFWEMARLDLADPGFLRTDASKGRNHVGPVNERMLD